MEEREKSGDKINPQIKQMIVAEYANIFLTLSMGLAWRIALFLSPVLPAPADGTAALIHPKLGQVSLFTSGLSDAIMLELFKETLNM